MELSIIGANENLFISFTVIFPGAFDMKCFGAYDNSLIGQLAQMNIARNPDRKQSQMSRQLLVCQNRVKLLMKLD